MLQGIEKLPVMQLKIDTPLPPDLDWVEVARVRHAFNYGRTSRDVTWVHPIVGRSETGDVYYTLKEDRSGPELVGCIPAKDIKTYKTLVKF